MINNNIKSKDGGFSLLELVIAVGVLLVLTVGGLLAYNGITKNARQAAVNNAADTVYNRAMEYKTDNLSETNLQTAIDEWNTASGALPDEVAVANVVAAIGVNKEKIVVEGTDLGYDDFEIKATYGDPNDDKPDKIQAVKRSVGAPLEEDDYPVEIRSEAFYVEKLGSDADNDLLYQIVRNPDLTTLPDDFNLKVNITFSTPLSMSQAERNRFMNKNSSFTIHEVGNNKEYVLEISNLKNDINFTLPEPSNCENGGFYFYLSSDNPEVEVNQAVFSNLIGCG